MNHYHLWWSQSPDLRGQCTTLSLYIELFLSSHCLTCKLAVFNLVLTFFEEFSDGLHLNWPIKVQELWEVELLRSMFTLTVVNYTCLARCVLIGQMNKLSKIIEKLCQVVAVQCVPLIIELKVCEKVFVCCFCWLLIALNLRIQSIMPTDALYMVACKFIDFAKFWSH